MFPGSAGKNWIPYVAKNFKRILKQGLIIMSLRGSLLHCYYCDPVYIIPALHLEWSLINLYLLIHTVLITVHLGVYYDAWTELEIWDMLFL